MSKKTAAAGALTSVVFLNRSGEQTTVSVGDGATERVGSDRYPYTIIQVLSPNRIVVQRDSFKRTDNNGLSESQSYEFSRNENGETITLSYRPKWHRWYPVGQSLNKGRGSCYWHLGKREAYQDPSF